MNSTFSGDFSQLENREVEEFETGSGWAEDTSPVAKTSLTATFMHDCYYNYYSCYFYLLFEDVATKKICQCLYSNMCEFQ